MIEMNFTKKAAYCASLLFFVVSSLLFSLRPASAQTDQAATNQEKSYYYPSIATTIHINKDSTIDVTEVQTFAFTGNFHAGERDVLLRKVSGVTDFSITDVTTGNFLAAIGELVDLPVILNDIKVIEAYAKSLKI